MEGIRLRHLHKRTNPGSAPGLYNLSQEIRKNSDSIKQLKDNTRDLEESLTINQDLVEEKLNTLKSQLKVIQNEVSENKAEL